MSGFSFEWWWMFFALPLPILIYQLRSVTTVRAQIALPHMVGVSGRISQRDKLCKVMAILGWVALVTASARPVWFDEPLPFTLNIAI
ncbi:BatA bacteroides aerotolerance operon [Vibrio maritimus]|uniref:BatA bacteroides aerotolerance operon n=1 Tax=Vibrio maritimus TaxID=990268 RepID=A0A090T9L4_9VIBR|nr:BatA bacteroides aerotolerance operon [Vibrio maritimus]